MPSLSQFIAGRRAAWAKLEVLLDRSEGNRLRTLTAGDLDALGHGYREVVSDLAVARRDFPDDQLTDALNSLAARAHLRLYRAPAASWRNLLGFFWFGLPRRFRQAGGYVAAAALLLFGPAIWAYFAALYSPEMRAALVPAELRSVMETGHTWHDFEVAIRPFLAAVIFTNNIRVSFMAFAAGISFGLGTAYVLVSNGLSIGAILGAGQYYGVTPLLLAFISAHGYLELTAICIAGGAGLMIGHALLRPGLLRRRDALARSGRLAVELVLGTVPILIIAGLVEGLISPGELPAEFKYALGPILGLLLFTFLFTVGRPRGKLD
jgi:uncharacterized membrane protein SpoIIM required for sporulation